MKRLSLPGALGLLLALVSVCWADVILRGAGATFPQPLYQKWIEVYQGRSNVRISYDSVGSGTGIKRLTERSVDFGATDVFLTDEERERAPGQILHIPTCVGAVAVIYNLPLNRELRLTPEVIADIFLGNIRKWSDESIAKINPDVKLPDKRITVVHRSDSSGTTFIFTDYLSRAVAKWRERAGFGKSVQFPAGLGVEGNPGMVEFVAKIPGAIGYTELAYARDKKLPVATVRNRSGHFVTPTLASIGAAAGNGTYRGLKMKITDCEAPEGYPISSFSFLICYREQAFGDALPERARSLADFLWWAVHDGQRVNRELSYGTLPPEVVVEVEEMIRSMTFNGKPLREG